MVELKREIYVLMREWINDKSRQVLEVRGTRQVGKTYAIKKLAKENFKDYLYINCAETTGARFLQSIRKMETAGYSDNLVVKAVLDYDAAFTDSPDNVIVIDEIQESSRIYNLIREFRRNFQSRLIITGSYLARIVTGDNDEDNSKFFLPVGDLHRIEMETLTFREFLTAVGADDLYDKVEIYGGSTSESYGALHNWYKIYETIGGYPAVVASYVEERDIGKCQAILEHIITIFSEESSRYFRSIVDIGNFQSLLYGIGLVMLREKTGVDFIKDLTKIVAKEDKGKVGRTEVIKAVSWLAASHVIGYVDKYDFETKDVVLNQRIYFRDIGVAYHFLTHAEADWESIYGILAENFAFLSMKRRRGEITGERPFFGFDQKTQGELDFYARGWKSRKKYGIEVKSGDNPGKTARRLLQRKNVDELYYFKLDTHGGKMEHIHTIPLYLIDKVKFE